MSTIEHCQTKVGWIRVSPVYRKMSAATRTPEAEGLDVVLVGSFNPAIFHPEWFFRQGIVTEQDANEAKVQDVSGEITIVQICGILLQCVSDKFGFSTKNISNAERMQDMTRQTFRLLSHTPITACGINPHVHYLVASDAYWHKIGHTLAPKELVWNEILDRPGMQSLTIKAPRNGDFPGEINVTVEPSAKHRPGVFVKANNHYAIPEAAVHDRAAELVMKFIEAEWKPACNMARKVAEQIFTRITPDHE
jgi:hypothetical protein